jgi:hypothetical protein
LIVSSENDDEIEEGKEGGEAGSNKIPLGKGKNANGSKVGKRWEGGREDDLTGMAEKVGDEGKKEYFSVCFHGEN